MHRFNTLCRVCGGGLQKAKKRAPTHKCTNYTKELEATFGIGVGTDDPDIHPEFFCNKCYAAMKRQSTAATKGVPYHHSVAVFSWMKHTEGACTVCMKCIVYSLLVSIHYLGM